MTKTQQLINDRFGSLNPSFDFPLVQKTYFKIGGPAEVYLQLEKLPDVQQLIKFCQQNKIKLTVIGGASNILIDDSGVSGVVLQITANQFTQLDQFTFSAQAGMKMAALVKKSLDLHLTGLEYFLGVPGTLGGAIYNNAHYLQDLIGEHIIEVEVINSQGDLETLTKAECQFGYDSSRFQSSKEIIWSATFSLRLGDYQQSKELVKKATLYRAQTQPLAEPSSGCIFQNVPNNDHLKKLFPQFAEKSHVPGGFLIDQAGLKGQNIGDIYVSDIHAAFLVNKGKGKSKQVLEMIRLIKDKVKDKFDVDLKEEVFYLK